MKVRTSTPWITPLLFLATMMTASACSSILAPDEDQRLGHDFGDSVRAVQLAQRANPNAPVDYEPVEEMEAFAALNMLEAYQRSFIPKEQEAPAALFSFQK